MVDIPPASMSCFEGPLDPGSTSMPAYLTDCDPSTAHQFVEVKSRSRDYDLIARPVGPAPCAIILLSHLLRKWRAQFF